MPYVSFWQAALGVGGVAAIMAFVFWSLYRQAVSSPHLAKLTRHQLFVIFLVFLGLTFLFSIAGLVTYLVESNQRLRNATSLINSEEFKAYLADRRQAGEAAFTNARMRDNETMKIMRAISSSVSADAGPTTREREADERRAKLLTSLENRHKELMDAALAAAEAGDITRCFLVMRDLRDLAHTPEAREVLEDNVWKLGNLEDEKRSRRDG